MLEYINTIYVLPIFATLIGILIVYLYDKFEKKQYTSAIYLRIALLIYVSSCGMFYISKMDYFNNLSILSNMQSGGSSNDPQSLMPQPNEIKINNFEQFKTGVPTF
jgi:hypothetical protein